MNVKDPCRCAWASLLWALSSLTKEALSATSSGCRSKDVGEYRGEEGLRGLTGGLLLLREKTESQLWSEARSGELIVRCW